MKRLRGGLHFTVHPVLDPGCLTATHPARIQTGETQFRAATIAKALSDRSSQAITATIHYRGGAAPKDVHLDRRPRLSRRSSHLHLDVIRRVASRVTKHSQIGISEIGDLFQKGHPAFQKSASPNKSQHNTLPPSLSLRVLTLLPFPHRR